MTKFLVSTAAALFLVAAPFAYAQDHGGGRPGGGEQGGQHGGGQHAGGQRPGGNNGGRPGGENRPGNNGLRPGTIPGQRPGNAGSRPGENRPGGNVGRPGNMGRPGGGRPNYNQYRRTFRAPQRFHAGAYRRPAGWYSRRWAYGDILPRLFWSRDYWLLNYMAYGLMAPPPGTVWIRNGDDAILIDQYSGEVIQVAYGVFY